MWFPAAGAQGHFLRGYMVGWIDEVAVGVLPGSFKRTKPWLVNLKSEFDEESYIGFYALWFSASLM